MPRKIPIHGWLVIFLLLGPVSATAQNAPTVAVAGFTFADSSGELADQAERHRLQLAEFESGVLDELKRHSQIRPVQLCPTARCTAGDPGMEALVASAKRANADYLIAGGLHKMSTLVGWAKLVVVDLTQADRYCDRLVTYRGDTPEAWKRAAEFSARDIASRCFPR